MDYSAPENTCCFTGHRNLPLQDQEKIYRLARNRISFLMENGISAFLAGGAVGFDLMCSRIVLDLKQTHPYARLEIVIPSPDYDKFFSEKTKMLYSRIFQKADDIVFISKEYTIKSIFLRNMYMVDRSSHLVCFCTKQEGGSFFTMSYAKKKNLTIYNVIP